MAAPSSRNRVSKSWQSRSTLSRTFRIKKSEAQASKTKLDAIEGELNTKQQIAVQTQNPELNGKKRRRDDANALDEEEGAMALRRARKARLSVLPTPPSSSDELDILPDTLLELIAIHKTFTQALGLHYAHNGTSSTVSLSLLLPAITRLWKRRTVCLQDIQRMLALWESTLSTSGRELDHNKGPFKLVSVGSGTNEQVNLERTTNLTISGFDQNELQSRYERLVDVLYEQAQSDRNSYSFVFETLLHFPKLRCTTGTCTRAAQTKFDTIRKQILGRPQKTSNSEPDLSKLNISDPCAQPKPLKLEDRLKCRTLGLFDRLKAKQLANSTSGAAPTSAELLRRRALHRMPDLIDVLRLKQSQKLNHLFRSDLHGSPSTTRATKTKVSFSLEQLVQEIRDSGRVPIAPEEIRECLQILGCEVPDTWCSVYSGTGINCVTLQGDGWTKEAIKGWCSKELQRTGAQPFL